MRRLSSFRRWSGAKPAAPFGVSVLGGAAKLGIDCTGTDPAAPGGCMVRVDRSSGPSGTAQAATFKIGWAHCDSSYQ